MLQQPLPNLESLEAISQNDCARRFFLNMAALSRTGRMTTFLQAVELDDELDDETKGSLNELAHEHEFLVAVEDYLRRTPVLPRA